MAGGRRRSRSCARARARRGLGQPRPVLQRLHCDRPAITALRWDRLHDRGACMYGGFAHAGRTRDRGRHRGVTGVGCFVRAFARLRVRIGVLRACGGGARVLCDTQDRREGVPARCVRPHPFPARRRGYSSATRPQETRASLRRARGSARPPCRSVSRAPRR